MFVKGRLKPDVTSDQAAANLNLIGKRLQTTYVQTNKDREVSIVPTKDVHIHPLADRMLLPIALGLMLVVGLVLVIACANVASMLLARASGPPEGNRYPPRDRREPRAADPAAALRERRHRRCWARPPASLLAWALTRVAMSIQLPIPIPLSFALRIDGACCSSPPASPCSPRSSPVWRRR